jgi:hypothetical protein
LLSKKNVTINGASVVITGNAGDACLLRTQDSAVVTFRRIHFHGITGTDIAVAGAYSGSTLNVESCIFSGTTSTGSTAALYALASTLNVRGCTFYNNTASGSGNTGVFYSNSNYNVITLTGNIFWGNTTTSGKIVHCNGAGPVTSGGYNVWDSESATNFSFNATGDVQSSTAPIDTATFMPLPNGAAAGTLPATLPSNYPTEDFNGNAISAGGQSGAVQTIPSAPAITTPASALTSGFVGTSYGVMLTATGYPTPTWSVTEGNLPSGLTLNATTGEISGTPTTAVGGPFTFTFTVTATNDHGSATAEFSIVIRATAPTGLKATPETAADENDGTISGVTDAMEYRIVTEPPSRYSPVPPNATTLTGLAPGVYEVRFAATANYAESPAVQVAVVAPPVEQGDFTIAVANTLGTGYTYTSNTLFITAAGHYVIGMKTPGSTTTADCIVVRPGLTNVNITLNNVSIDKQNATSISAFDMRDATVNLSLQGTNVLKSGNFLGGIAVESGSSLTIDGSGSLSVTGGLYASGIGGGYGSSCGDITINGGTVNATGGSDGAGIGSGFGGGSNGTLTITGGSVKRSGTADYREATAKNGDSANVYLTTLTVGDPAI